MRKGRSLGFEGMKVLLQTLLLKAQMYKTKDAEVSTGTE